MGSSNDLFPSRRLHRRTAKRSIARCLVKIAHAIIIFAPRIGPNLFTPMQIARFARARAARNRQPYRRTTFVLRIRSTGTMLAVAPNTDSDGPVWGRQYAFRILGSGHLNYVPGCLRQRKPNGSFGRGAVIARRHLHRIELPEPTTLALMGLGLLALAGRKRTRRE